MSAADVSSLVDIASSSDVTPTETPVETEVVETETPEESSVETSDTDETQSADDVSGADKPVDGRTNPAAIRSALKAFRDLDPKNAPIARELNDAYGRYSAYKQVFPKVADAQNAKALLDAVGGDAGLSALQDTIKSANETDALLYAGDPRLFDQLIEDFKAENKLDAFGKLASPFLDKLRGVDEKAYFDAVKPHFFQGLVDANLPGVLGALSKALAGETPNLEVVKGLIGEMTQWFDNLRNSVETKDKTKLDPERQAFEKERTEFQTSKQKEFQTGVATSCDSHNNTALGTALKPFLKLPFFKGFTRDSLIDLGNGLKGKLFSELKADATYQAQMDAFWSAKSPDKAKIEQYHKAKVDTMAKRIVQTMLETRYPGYAKKTSAAGAAAGRGKPAAAAAAAKGVADQPQQTKPLFVQTKPAWESIDWDKDPNKMLFITGRAYLKTGKFVTWSPKYK